MTKREKELIEKGWEKRFIEKEPRLSEIVELYESIGYEVHLEPLPPKEERENCENEGCSLCYEAEREKYRIIFTRQKPKTS